MSQASASNRRDQPKTRPVLNGDDDGRSNHRADNPVTGRTNQIMPTPLCTSQKPEPKPATGGPARLSSVGKLALRSSEAGTPAPRLASPAASKAGSNCTAASAAAVRAVHTPTPAQRARARA